MDWDSLQNNNVDIYSGNITSTILSIAKECIPNRHITIRPSEPPWITTEIKRTIRKRKKAYRKAKSTGLEIDCQKFKKVRNSVVNIVRKCKKAFYDKLALKLKSESLSSKDWWSTLKKFNSPQSKSSVPPLEFNNSIYTDDHDKATIINIVFQSQPLLKEQNAVFPDLHLDTIEPQLSHIVLSPNEVERMLETLPIGYASGPNAISNRILRELSSELSVPLCSLFNHSLHTGCVPISYKEANVTSVPKRET